MEIDNQKIIKRGFATKEELETMFESEKLSKLNIKEPEGMSEGIWIYALEDDNTSGKDFHFVFFNSALMFLPRDSHGRVGVATSNGPEKRADATLEKCLTTMKWPVEETN